MTYIPIDFEYNHVNEEKLNLVAVAWLCPYENVKCKLWLHNNPLIQDEFKSLIENWKHDFGDDLIFLSYNVVAEARCFYSMGLDPMEFQWFCLFTEYKHIMNQNNRVAYGKQLIDGKKKFTRPPKNKYFMTEEEKQAASFDKAQTGLAAACYKMLGVEIDTAQKTRVRDLIISAPDRFTGEEVAEICEYAESDIEYLLPLKDAIVEEFQHLLRKTPQQLSKLREEVLFRGRYNALTAIRESKGYHFDYDATRNLSRSIPKIIYDIQKEINGLFPEIMPFGFLIKDNRFKKNTKNIKEWIAKQPFAEDWMRTDSGDYSLALEAWTKFFDFKHDYPKNNFGAQYVRYLKTEMNLKGFAESGSGKAKKFWDYVGPDKMVRPYMNIYGAQTSRTQPKANGFIALKPAWMRALQTPPPGYLACSIDYKSEEFLISAINAMDEAMIEAYDSGDQYLWFGIRAGIIPQGGTKKTHPTERQNCKNTVLGISYGMGAKALAQKLTNDGDREYDEEEAQEYIDNFFGTFWKYAEYREQLLDSYYKNGYLKLQDGWYMWGDNWNERSVMNFPSQGAGGCVMRYADFRSHENGAWVPFTLHDALYAYLPANLDCPEDIVQRISGFEISLKYGFMNMYKDDPDRFKHASKIRLDVDLWGPGATELNIPGVKCQEVYVDERGESEYNQFKKYFNTRPGGFL